MGRNRLLPLLAGIAILAVTLIVYRAATKPGPVTAEPGEPLAATPEPITVDADSPADTIRSISGQAEMLQTQIEEARQEADSLRNENRALNEELEIQTQQISSLIEDKLAEQRAQSDETVSGIEKRLRTMTSSFQRLSDNVTERLSSVEQNTEVPIGLGLDTRYESGQVIRGEAVDPVVWINPLDLPAVDTAAASPPLSDTTTQSTRNVLFPVNGTPAETSTVQRLQQRVGTTLSNATSPSSATSDPDIVPYYTLPDLSVLANSTALSSLIGRVYLDDRVINPYPFKVVIGQDNLTANFKDLPEEINGLIVGGYTEGDWPLSCVRGTITAATFVFDDGTVKSAYPGDPGSRPEDSGFQSEGIGYISDPFGNPCILGEQVTDAPKFLVQRALLAGAEGYAEALRQQQIDTVRFVGPDGTATQEIFNGDAADFARANVYVSAIQETTDWIRERQRQSFDVIYVPPAQRVVVNLEQELRIDLDTSGRQINYHRGGRTNARLD